MDDRVLIDTDVLIDASRAVAEAVSRLATEERSGKLAISAVTEFELILGCRDNRELRRLDRFLRRFQIVQIAEHVSSRASALLRTYYLSHGLLIPDSLIAATALEHDMPLLTKNRRDFQFIADLHLLKYP